MRNYGFLLVFLLFNFCGSGQESEEYGFELQPQLDSRGYYNLQVKIGNKAFAFVAHGGYMAFNKTTNSSYIFPLLGFHSGSEQLHRSYEGYMFGAGAAYRMWVTDVLSFSFNATLDYARLQHEVLLTSRSSSVTIIPPFFREGHRSFRESVNKNHFSLRLAYETRLHLDRFYFSLTLGIDPQLSEREPITLRGPEGSAETYLLTDGIPLFGGLGVGIIL